MPNNSDPTTLTPVPDHPEQRHMRWSELERKAIADHGHACAEAARAPLAEENARLLARVAELEADCAALRAGSNLVAGILTEAREERDRLRAEVDAKTGEVEALRGFAQRVMESWPHDDVDGGDLQESAHAAGLLAPITATEPCGESCSCAEWGEWPIECYRKTDLLKGTGPWINPLAAELEKLRAASVIEWEPGRSYTAAELLRRAIRGIRGRKSRSICPAVENLFGCGNTVARYLCRWAGRDPDTGKDIAARKGEGSEGAAQAKEGAE